MGSQNPQMLAGVSKPAECPIKDLKAGIPGFQASRLAAVGRAVVRPIDNLQSEIQASKDASCSK